MRMCKFPGSRNRLGVLVLFTVIPVFLWACAITGISRFDLKPAGGDQASFTHEGLTITSRYLDDGDRIQYLRAAGREALSRELRDMPLITFFLQVVNKSGSEVIIDPSGTRFVTGFGPMLGPMSYAHLYMALPKERRRQKVLQDFQGIAFDRPVNVPPDGIEERILFFQRPEKVGKDVTIILDGLYLGGVQLKAVLAFNAVSLPE